MGDREVIDFQYIIRNLKPCPFCNKGTTEIRENGRTWLGMKYSDPISVSIMHWCERIDGQPESRIEIKGRDLESAVKIWERN